MQSVDAVLDRLKATIPGSVRNHARQWRNRAARFRGRAHLRELAPRPELASGSLTSSRINELLSRNKGDAYLEIGVADGETLEAISATRRTGVDPWPMFALDRIPEGIEFHPVRSDQFFAAVAEGWAVDAVLLDGLHEFRQTYADLRNSLGHLRAGGSSSSTTPFPPTPSPPIQSNPA